MKKTLSMYILFFFTNSCVYALVIETKKKLFHDPTLTDRAYVGFAVVGALSVVSVLSYRVGLVSLRYAKKSKNRFVVALILITVVSMLMDFFLLSLATCLIVELKTNLFDRIIMAGLSQAISVRVICTD